MSKKEFKSVMRFVGACGRIMLKGFLRMMYGTATAGLFAMAIGGFIMITGVSGWTAVIEFIASVCTTVVAVTCMYAIGGGVKKGAKK